MKMSKTISLRLFFSILLLFFTWSIASASYSLAYNIFLPLIKNENLPVPTPIPPTPTSQPDNQKPKGDGFYRVNTDIAAGKWHSTGNGTSCYWARYDSNQEILLNHFGLAGGTVNINTTDYEVELNRCGIWEYVENQEKVLKPDAVDPKGDGFYTIGVEIAAGRWKSTGTGDSCYWARLDENQDILLNHFGLAGGTVKIQESDYEVEFDRCGTWTYLGPE